MEAENNLGARGMFDSKALITDGNAAVGADFEGSSDAPNIRPPRAARGFSQDRALFLLGQFPGVLGGHPQFPVGFMGIAVESQSVDVGIGDFDLGNLFADEIGWKSALPELVFALDFPLGLWRWGIEETNVVKLECPAQLGERIGILREKDGVIIDVDLQGSAIAQESGGKKIKVGQEEFSIIEFGTNEYAAAIVEHVEHRVVDRRSGKPAMGRGIQLPKFADLRSLPAANRRAGSFRHHGVGVTIFDSPAPDLGTIQFERMQAEGFGSDKAVGARR